VWGKGGGGSHSDFRIKKVGQQDPKKRGSTYPSPGFDERNLSNGKNSVLGVTVEYWIKEKRHGKPIRKTDGLGGNPYS